MTVYNCTPHNIRIYAKADTEYVPQLRKAFVSPDALPLLEIPPSGIVLSAHYFKMCPAFKIEKLVPVSRQLVESIDQPTDLFSNFDASIDWLIVSALYADAARQLNKKAWPLLCVNNVVYANQHSPAPVGCLGLTLK